MDAPSTEELDGVALYIITARELKSCRFFVEEHHQLSISFRHGDPPEAVQGRFPDPDTVSAALIPFRKLWMKGEPCFYRHVANTIKMHCEDLRWLVDFSFCLNSDAPRMVPFLRDVELSTEDVVDMWLNTRYMHVGKARRKGRFSREDFARWERDIGPTLFEYYFHIYANGDISPCVFSPVACGNILDIIERRSEYRSLDDFVNRHPLFVKFREKQKEITDWRAPCMLMDHPEKIRSICAEVSSWFPANNMPKGYLDGGIARALDACSRAWCDALRDIPLVPECVQRDLAARRGQHRHTDAA